MKIAGHRSTNRQLHNPEALIAYEKAIAFDPTFQAAIDNKKNLVALMNK